MSLAARFLRIPVREVTCRRRGFVVAAPGVAGRLEDIGATFLHGYHSALEARSLANLVGRLNSVATENRGFAFEGAAMALTILDHLTPWNRNRLNAFLRGPGDPHKYMVHVGVGWALARLPIRQPSLDLLDPMLKWLAIDGIGFHEGYFYWEKYSGPSRTRKRPGGYGARAFDQGFGRSLWFVAGADIEKISARIAGFEAQRRGDLWSGIGLACAYAGVVARWQLEQLKDASGCYIANLAQGAAFAAKARQRAGNPAPHTEIACQVLCGTSADGAAAVTDIALREIEVVPDVPLYEVWRRRIGAVLAKQEVVRL